MGQVKSMIESRPTLIRSLLTLIRSLLTLQVKSMIESRPRLDLYTGWIPNSDFMPIRRHYPETSLVNAWTKLVEATLPSGSDGYMAPAAAVFDMVDVTRQVLSDLFARLFVQIVGYVYAKTKQGVPLPTGSITSTTLAEEQMQLMLGMIRDLDELLGTQVSFDTN